MAGWATPAGTGSSTWPSCGRSDCRLRFGLSSEGGRYPEYEGELYAAYLREHQRKGLGRQLLGAVAEGLAAKGRHSLLAWVLAENPSRLFYEAVGGKLLGSQEIEIGGVTLEEVAYGWDDTRETRRARKIAHRARTTCV